MTSTLSRGRPLASVPNPIDTFTSGLASILRINHGVTVEEQAARGLMDPLVLKELYDIENNPSCRRVRERITELDLCVDKVIPCAKASKARQELGKDAVIPRLVAQVDGEDVVVEGDSKIIEFLDKQTGIPTVVSDEAWKEALLELADFVGGFGASALRMGRGTQVSPAIGPRPDQPLILYDYAGNQFCRLVREVLTELDIPFTLRSTGKGSPRRQELLKLTGNSTQCPYLVDPNTGVAMAESAEIVKYLYKTYAKWTPPNEMLRWVSQYVMPLAKPLFRKLAPYQAGLGSSATPDAYREKLDKVRAQVESEIRSSPVVIYTYSLSPFSSEAKALLDSIGVEYTEICLGREWIPGLIDEGGAEKRAALLDMTGQSSLPQIFVGGESIGGLFSGTPGLLPGLEKDDSLLEKIKTAQKGDFFLPLVPDMTGASTPKTETVDAPSPLFFAVESNSEDTAETKEDVVVREPPSQPESIAVEETVVEDMAETAGIAIQEDSTATDSITKESSTERSSLSDMAERIKAVRQSASERSQPRTELAVEVEITPDSSSEPRQESMEAVEVNEAVFDPPPSRPPLKPSPTFAGTTDPVKAEATARGLLIRRLTEEKGSSGDMAKSLDAETSEETEQAVQTKKTIPAVTPPPSRPPLKPTPATATATDPVKAETVARAMLARRLTEKTLSLEAPNEMEGEPIVLVPQPATRPPMKSSPVISRTTDPIKAEAVARELLARRLAEPKVTRRVVLDPHPPTRPPLKPAPPTVSRADPVRAEAVARQLLARRLAEPKPTPRIALDPPPPTRPPLKPTSPQANVADPVKAEAVARELLARRLAQPKPTPRIVLDPLPPTRPPLKPTSPQANVADPVKAEAVARELLARRLAAKAVPKSTVPLGPPPPTRPPLKPVPFTATPSDPVKAEMVSRQLLVRRLANQPKVEASQTPEDESELAKRIKLGNSFEAKRSKAEEKVAPENQRPVSGASIPVVSEMVSPAPTAKSDSSSNPPAADSISISSDQEGSFGSNTMFDTEMKKTNVFERKASKRSERRKREKNDLDVSS